MSRNQWCVLALVGIAVVATVASIIIGVSVEHPLAPILIVLAIGLMIAIGTTVYCASEFNIAAHQVPPAVAPQADPVVQTPPAVPLAPQTPPATTPAHRHTTMVLVGGLIALAIIVGGIVAGVYLNTYHPDPAVTEAAAQETVRRLMDAP